MLAKKYRLAASFFKPGKTGKKIVASLQSKGLNIKFFYSSLPYSRFAVVAPLSAFSKVVERNKFKRLAYESIRKFGLERVSGRDVVIYLKRDIRELKKSDIEKTIVDLLKNNSK